METKKFSKDFYKLALGTLGVVYGDLGTSPLYTIKECFSPSHGLPLSHDNILGILSLIFWAMMLVIVLKYIMHVLKADNQGEGGIISLLSLIIPKIEKEKALIPIVFIGLIGTSLLLAEGMITPAITVLGAVEGLEMAAPVLEPFIIPITICILIGIFIVQKKGTEKIGSIFGPLMIIWFTTIGVLGLFYVVKAPQVVFAMNPLYGINYFVRNGFSGFFILGSVVLAITGTEALFADLGHFGRGPLKFSFFTMVMPALILNYFGQGAAVLLNGARAAENPFYFLSPDWFIFPLIVIATIAAIIASQALISGAFSLVQQAIQLGYLPKIRIFHTSKEFRGQIYIPFINYSLMSVCILLVLSFKTSGNLASAYGISVMGTMLCTTTLFYILSSKVWKWSRMKSGLLCMIFFIVDISFLGANIPKFTTGGWLPLLVGIVLFTLMRTWKMGSLLVFKNISRANMPLEILIQDIKNGIGNIQRVSGNAVFMVGSRNLGVLLHHLKHNKVLHENVFLLSVIYEKVPYIDHKTRVNVVAYDEGFFEVTARYGYMEQPDIQDILSACDEKCLYLNINQISFYLGRVNIDVTGNNKMYMWQKKLFAFMHRNAETAVEYFKLPPGRAIELGTKVSI